MHEMKARHALIVALLVILGLQTGAKAYEPPMVRVKIDAVGKAVALEGEGMSWRAKKASGKSDRLTLSWDGRKLAIDKRAVSPPVTITAKDMIEVDGAAYRGELLITKASPPLIVNRVDVESYLAGVVNQEIDSKWPRAAVDAQVIIARSYAMARARERKAGPYDLDRTAMDQVYGGVAAEDDLAWAAVKRTSGLIVAYGKKPVLPNFHACCGGRTEAPSDVWGGKNQPFQVSVACPYCQDATRFFWRYPEAGALPGQKLAGLLGLTGAVESVKVSKKTPSGRAARVEVVGADGTRGFSGLEFRKLIGYHKLFSTLFEAEKVDGGFVFRGSGAGHGAGMCQWGARGMARAGFTSFEILGYYYPGVEVVSFGGVK